MNTDNPTGTTLGSSLEPVNSQQSRIITKVLSPALQLWLRSQVQQVSNLEVKISGSDRQMLTGHIERVSISATCVVYQGLHLSQLQLVGENIRINLGQVLRGQPLRLLEPVPMFGQLLLQESDLNASLRAPMLATALTEFLVTLLKSSSDSGLSALVRSEQQLRWQNPQIKIKSEQLTLSATLVPTTGNSTSLTIHTGLQLASSHELQLNHTQIETQQGLVLNTRDNLKLDLGLEVAIDELKLTPGQLICRGRINIIPAE